MTPRRFRPGRPDRTGPRRLPGRAALRVNAAPRALPAPIVLLALLAGCAAGAPTRPPSPSELAVLEARARAAPEDAAALTRLGAAFAAIGRSADARATLERAVALDDAPPAAWVHLGTLREEAGDVEGAAAAYRRYLRTGGPLSPDVEARLEGVDRRLLAARARDALAREAELAAVPADPATVGVLPLVVEGPPEYAPLGVGLAELLTTDLSVTGRLTVLERAQLAALLMEMRLALAGFTDPAAAARAGRLLSAGRVVQGRIAIAELGGETEVLALVVDAADPASAGEVEERGGLEELMELEVQLALALYRELGIELTAAERARIEQKPTRNLQAFLAYSEGLQLMDDGDYAGAAARFDAAADLDPGFTAARAAAERAGRMSAVTPAGLRQAAAIELGPAGGGGAGTLAMESLVDATVPAGTGATATGSPPATPGGGATVENTETTLGTGLGELVAIPIVLVRPRPALVPLSVVRGQR